MLKQRIKLGVFNTIAKALFHPALRERFCRQEFLYNAFRTLSFNGINGDYAEFGSFGCMTFALAYHEMKRRQFQGELWAYDSFQGLPENEGSKDDHPRWVKGAMTTPIEEFHRLCKIQNIPHGRYNVVPGFYEKTLKDLPIDAQPANIALAYIDSDLYSSAKIVLEFLHHRLKNGMILAFDDYFCYSSTAMSGERLAFLEYQQELKEWNFVPYMQFGWHGMSFIVEDVRLLPKPNETM